MSSWSAGKLRKAFLTFFQERGHTVLSSTSLVPENDPTVLFTTAGMHPLVPYLLGQPHSGGKRLVSCQKCIRTQDIDEVGDATHDTFFEMLGNWSLGDYFKKEAIAWSWEFLTGGQWLGLDAERIFVSVFAGDADAPRDKEAATIWQEVGVPLRHVSYLPKKDNWWGPAGLTGPCGPDTEMFYDLTGKVCKAGEHCLAGCECGRFLEIWNDVFMQYNKKADGSYEPLKQHNVDTGMGLERTLMVLQGTKDIFATDVFAPIMTKLQSLVGTKTDNVRSLRIVTDHVRTATFILAEPNEVSPSNLAQGYVLRRLIRRAIRHGRLLGLDKSFLPGLAQEVIALFKEEYPELGHNQERALRELALEEERFQHTLAKGLKQFQLLLTSHKDKRLSDKQFSGAEVFDLFATCGFPLEMTEELAREQGMTIDKAGFAKEFAKHQELSRTDAEQKFKGGLADHSVATTRLHTANHLLQQALRDVLGTHVVQKGSNITPERLRFDFPHPQKLTPSELKRVEEIVNEKIKAALPVSYQEMTVAEAKEQGALGVFDERYGERVKVYSMGNYSQEICGGPHVANTAELGGFKIIKEEAVAAGIRRIKAVVTANHG